MFSKKLYGNFFYDLFSRTHSKYTVMFFIYLVLLKFLRIHVISFFSGFLEKTLFRVKCWLWLSRCSPTILFTEIQTGTDSYTWMKIFCY